MSIDEVRPLVSHVRVSSYKSIGRADVRLGSLALLVGPNGVGKSNFLDVLRFVSDALNTTLDQAVRDRGGINEVRRRSSGHPNHFGVRLELQLANGGLAYYAFKIGAVAPNGFVVQREQCTVMDGTGISKFVVDDGVVSSTVGSLPRAMPDRLHLVAASSHDAFRSVFDVLAGMRFYNLNPAAIREHQPADSGEVLRRDGSNLASVIGRMGDHAPAVKLRLEEYLRQTVPGIVGLSRREYGARESLEFKQDVRGARHAWDFPATSMSDGTLRAVGVLAALLQPHVGRGTSPGVSLVGIEEPEVALHPAAAGVLMDALREAALTTQILVTTHSPDLLDNSEIDTDVVRVVRASNDVTEIGEVDDAGREAVRRHLFTAGELLRADQLVPDADSVAMAKETTGRLRLFEVPTS